MIQRRDERKEGGRHNRNILKKNHKKREVKNKVGREIMKRDRKDKACWSK